MNFGNKTLNFQHFSWALGLLVSFWGSVSLAEKAETAEELFKDLPREIATEADACLNEKFLDHIKTVNVAQPSNVKHSKQNIVLESIKPDSLEENIKTKCVNNTFTKTGMPGVKYNLFDSSKRRVPLKLNLAKEEKTVRPGVCESSYEALYIAYQQAKKFRIDICREYADFRVDIEDCVDTKSAEKICISKLSKMINSVEKLKERNKIAREKIVAFIDSHEKLNASAISNFKRDGEVLTSPAFQPSQLEMPSYSGPRGIINAVDFGANNLREYLALIGTGKNSLSPELGLLSFSSIGKLVEEQENAALYLLSYKKQLSDQFISKEKDFGEKTASLNEQMKKVELSYPEESKWKENLTQYGPGAVTAGQQFFQKAPAASSGLAGASALAGLGAGAAIGSQVAGSRTSSIRSMPNSMPNVGNPVAPLENTILSKDTAPKNSSPQESETNAKLVETKTESSPANTKAVAAAQPSVFSSGASFKQNVFKSKTGKKGETSEAEVGRSDESLKSFGGDLLSAPAPKKVDTSGDVSSLLGQMKDLFNFDDPAAGGMMPPAPEGFGEATPEDLAATTGDQPFEEGGDGGEYTGEENQGRQYASAEEEIIGSPLQSRAYLGGIETPLFKRVKSRHIKCMEKGLVILGLGRLPE
jgi:hypothetical protein